MATDLINIGLAFIEGLALVLSPCILPILPIILSVSIEGSRKRPYGVILGFIISFALFTFFSRQLVLWFGFDLNLVRNIAFGLLLLLGVVMISEYLTAKFTLLTQRLGSLGLKATNNTQNSNFSSGIIFGALVGLVWTPCAGPILAAVIIQSILQQSSIASFMTVVAFALGAAIPMLIIVLFGRALTSKIKFFHVHAVFIRKLLGVVIIVAVIVMIYVPGLFVPSIKSSIPSDKFGTKLQDGLVMPFPAPEFKDISDWINSKPLNISQLRGKVVLIDFWAYSCINCIRTLPYLLDWYNKYHAQGLEIIGVHSPEFDFERNLKNVQMAVQQYGIRYPVALDNQFATWNNYHNQFWPAHYLINQDGEVVYEHFGEGKYEVTENNIRFLLGIKTLAAAGTEPAHDFSQTPETYLGYSRGEAFSSNESILRDQVTNYSLPEQLPKNAWALKGEWKIAAEKIVSTTPKALIKLHFSAKKVFAVMGVTDKPVAVTIVYAGKKNTMQVTAHNLYTILELPQASDGIVEITAAAAGLELYTFTFGN